MDCGIRSITTHQPVDEIVNRLTALLAEKNIKLFALIDHSGEAATAGLLMPNTKLLIFGNPKSGTPIMLSAPSAALDLPLKILVSQEPDGTAILFWNDPTWLQQRHNFSPDLVANLAAVETLAHKAAAQ
ncbi:MAG TPA: DUF302 domain-containing protein [Acidobacteriaceae bacterium]|nr:DUF302 domain-containing protein [Acidobacteriaceae bacterium]